MESGDHAICFTHAIAYTDKTIDLDVNRTKLETHPDILAKKSNANKSVGEDGQSAGVDDPATALAKQLEIKAGQVQADLIEMVHSLKHLRNREERNLDTVKSINKSIFTYGMLVSTIVVGMSILQVVILKTFFSASGQVRV